MQTFDVIVIGAGAAGLAAARELSGAGLRVLILEARERIGGRIHTLSIPDLPLPIELGAEFIHGEVESTFSIVEAASLAAVQLPDDHWWSENGELRRIDDFWGQIDSVCARIGTRQVSFAEFLRTQRLSPRLRELALTFVEGYHASHADRISARVLRSADSEQEGDNKQFRIMNGYAALAAWLRAGLDPKRADLRLGTPVSRVEWAPGRVTIDGSYRAKSAVVTLPIGVLKAGVVAFDPPLRSKERALETLEAGHVVKLAFRFRERFWGDVNFVHTSDRFMPTWWSTAPALAPVLTGWAGGHAADAMLAEGADAMPARAFEAMARAFSVTKKKIESLHAGTYMHDWQSDPFSRGAYSYAAVGGENAAEQLARPLNGTLFFAGEATSSDQTGTVAGAIESGRRAAAALIRATSRSERPRR